MRQLDQLYKSWKDSDSNQRKNLIAEPALFLKAAALGKSSKSSSAKTVGEAALNNDLEILVAVVRRCRRHVRDGVFAPCTQSHRHPVYLAGVDHGFWHLVPTNPKGDTRCWTAIPE